MCSKFRLPSLRTIQKLARVSKTQLLPIFPLPRRVLGPCAVLDDVCAKAYHENLDTGYFSSATSASAVDPSDSTALFDVFLVSLERIDTDMSLKIRAKKSLA